MTCIVGLADGGRVYIGGDSAGVADYAIDVRADAKVFRNREYLMGFTTSFRMGQLLRYSFKPPTPKGNLERFMVREFMPAAMDCLDAGGWLSVDKGRREGGTFLIGVRGELFGVWDDFQVGRTVNGYQSVGCGDAYALGSLHATAGQKPLARVRSALAAAAHHSAGVTGPFVIKSN